MTDEPDVPVSALKLSLWCERLLKEIDSVADRLTALKHDVEIMKKSADNQHKRAVDNQRKS